MVLSLFTLYRLPADTLSQSHASHKFLDQSSRKLLCERSSCFIFLSLSQRYIQQSEAFYEVGKGVSVIFEVVRGGECQQTSAPHYLGCKSLDNSGRNTQDLVQWLEVLAQLEKLTLML